MEARKEGQEGEDGGLELDGGADPAHASGAGVMPRHLLFTDGIETLDQSAGSTTSASASASSRVEAQGDDNANNSGAGLAGAGEESATSVLMASSTPASASGPTNPCAGQLALSDQVFNPVPTLALRSAAISMFLRGEGAPKAPGELAAAEQPTAGLCAGCVAAIGPL